MELHKLALADHLMKVLSDTPSHHVNTRKSIIILYFCYRLQVMPFCVKISKTELLWLQTWTNSWIVCFYLYFVHQGKTEFAQNVDMTILQPHDGIFSKLDSSIPPAGYYLCDPLLVPSDPITCAYTCHIVCRHKSLSKLKQRLDISLANFHVIPIIGWHQVSESCHAVFPLSSCSNQIHIHVETKTGWKSIHTHL